MSMTDNHERTITAFFKDRAHADKAKTDVISAGIPSAMVSIVEGQGSVTTQTTAAHDTHEGFWASLKDMFLPDEDRHAYAEGLRRGGYLLTVQTGGANYDKILDILDADGAEDMDQAEAQWKSEGWKGYEGTAATTTAGSAALAGSTAAIGGTNQSSAAAYGTTATPVAARSTGATGAAVAAETLAGSEDKIELVEENLRVGKRDVNHGRVRLRSYVVETPVHESVSLRSENVAVTRRPVDRALGAGEALFQDRTLEAEEHEEVAVVSKEARVVEEVSLGKTVQDRTQEINDTVRRTEVEVDDGRGNLGASRGSGTARFAIADAQRLISEHMDVIGSDGTKVGTVDHLDTGDRIKLAKNTSPDGQHHFIPLSWVEHVDQHVHLNKPVREIQAGWN